MLISTVEQARLRVSQDIDAARKSQLGQFFTPIRTAQFMASLFTTGVAGRGLHEARLLDAGAGIGSLSSAFLERSIGNEWKFKHVEVTAFELDGLIHEELNHSLATYQRHLAMSYKVLGGDFIEQAVNQIQLNSGDRFTHAILNPPYKKINSTSHHRQLLRSVGIETVNLYSAFLALALMLMETGGEIVAIVPRSFCNGPYYRPFRAFALKHAAIRHIHLFDARNKAFKDDKVLQENIILVLTRGLSQGDVTITRSDDDHFTSLTTYTHPFNRIVYPDDDARFIHVPTSAGQNTIELSRAIHCSLEEIGLSVSTGPVVDFRLKTHLRQMPELGTVPLLYPAHFTGHNIVWPQPGIKKPNAIHRNAETEKWLYPNGFYCVVRRFSSKEEKKRIVASVVKPDTFGNAEMLGLENHLNVYHAQKQGLPEALARGLVIYLSTTGVDENFRRSSGHTQVNATDLKRMKYPSRQALIQLGEWAMQCSQPTQKMIDAQLDNLSL